jgi:alkylated DNA nucleotide flippase Atl1
LTQTLTEAVSKKLEIIKGYKKNITDGDRFDGYIKGSAGVKIFDIARADIGAKYEHYYLRTDEGNISVNKKVVFEAIEKIVDNQVSTYHDISENFKGDDTATRQMRDMMKIQTFENLLSDVKSEFHLQDVDKNMEDIKRENNMLRKGWNINKEIGQKMKDKAKEMVDSENSIPDGYDDDAMP